MLKEEVAYRLSQSFFKEYKKRYNKILYNPKTVEKSKWWRYFEKAARFRNIDGWSPEIHVLSVFEKYNDVMPFFLYSDKALKAWEEYKAAFDHNKNNYLVQMLDTYKKIKKQYGEYNTDFYKDNLHLIKRKRYSIHFLSLSKVFREINDIEHIYSNEELDIKRIIVYNNKKVKEKMKEIFKEDLY